MLNKINLFISLLFNINWWEFPYYLFHKPILVKLIKKNLSFYVGSFREAIVLKEVIIDNQYEKYHRIKKGDAVIDIGAGLGDFSINASLKAKTVFAFEMNKKRAAMMGKNIIVNGRNNIQLFIEQAKTIRTVMKKTGVKQCNFLKVDCEGCEYELLRNTDKKTIEAIDTISMEAHLFNPVMEKDYSLLIEALKGYGFRVRETKSTDSSIRFVYANKKTVTS